MNKFLSVVVFAFIFFFTSLSAMTIETTQKTGYPKWDGLVELHRAGLPTPDGVFAKPYSTQKEVEKLVNSFIDQNNFSLIALRPDGKNGIGATPPGITFCVKETNKIINKVTEWSQEGYGVTLLETHNRFDYEFCCNVLLLNKEGNFTIEFVGPGFDGGDLNKSILKPTIVITNKIGSPIFLYSDPISGVPDIDTLNSLCFRINMTKRLVTEEEIHTRLMYISNTLLPDMGIILEKNAQATKKWLQENGCDGLLKTQNPEKFLSIEDLQQIIFFASKYVYYMLNSSQKFVGKALTVHKFNGSIVFFGTYDGNKWGGNNSNK